MNRPIPPPRQSGILLHPTSLPGSYGMGEIGREARRWVDALKEAGQQVWQILPLGPTGYGDSPYQSLSTFAGHPFWLGFDDLLEDGLLELADLQAFPVFYPLRISFGPVLEARREVLLRACSRFRGPRGAKLRAAAESFYRSEAVWLDDFTLFSALKKEQGGRAWTDWPEELRRRDPVALAEARRRLRREMDDVRIGQFLFDRQWRRLRRYAREKGVSLLGDLPFFVAHDSADVWANPHLFYLDSDGRPTVVAGVPPDYFSADGQRWGNPLYRWEVHAADGYAWWIARMRRAFDLADRVRLDHFRGLEKYWEIPAADATALNGRWVEGPGADLLQTLRTACGGLPLIAEDLGVITPEVDALREAFDLPGMKVLHFMFGDDPTAAKAARIPEDTVVYTGTHDNSTTVGWFTDPPRTDSTLSPELLAAERDRALRALGTDGSEIHWDLIRLAFRAPARLAVIPMQDVLGLGSEARMNRPGTSQGNWAWRFTWEQFSPALRDRLLRLTRETRREGPARRSRRKGDA
ncbi:MAG: 4-alpha-glucanotransferase [Kiritimatiellia bacterium]|nr:4-alpha-glucanotransferase [Kiritimatiellia bacterium]